MLIRFNHDSGCPSHRQFALLSGKSVGDHGRKQPECYGVKASLSSHATRVRMVKGQKQARNRNREIRDGRRTVQYCPFCRPTGI